MMSDQTRTDYIEFFGPPAAGKSTLCRAVLSTVRRGEFNYKSHRILAFGNKLPKPLLEAIERALHSRVAFIRKLASGLSFAHDERFMMHALTKEWDSEWENFLIKTLRDFSIHADKVEHAAKIHLLIKSIAYTHRAAFGHQTAQTILIDEGVLQRGISLAQLLNDGAHPLVQRYFETCPVPKLSICVTAPEEILVKRIISRGKGGAVHLPVVAASSRATTLGSAALARRGVSVLNIDTTENFEAASRKVIDFVRAKASSVAEFL